MRKLAMLSALVLLPLAATATPAQAREYPWCVVYGFGSYSCGFVSFAQCMATASGQNKAFCYQNPRYGYEPLGRKARNY